MKHKTISNKINRPLFFSSNSIWYIYNSRSSDNKRHSDTCLHNSRSSDTCLPHGAAIPPFIFSTSLNDLMCFSTTYGANGSSGLLADSPPRSSGLLAFQRTNNFAYHSTEYTIRPPRRWNKRPPRSSMHQRLQQFCALQHTSDTNC